MSFRVKMMLADRSVRDELWRSDLATYDPANDNAIIEQRSLQDVFNAVAEDPGAPLVKLARRHDIPLEILEMGMSYLIACMPDVYEKAAGAPATRKRFLIDENLPCSLGIKLWREFGMATHPKFHGKNTSKDPELWDWAVKRKFDAIITRDINMANEGIDLGMIALRHAFDYFKDRHPEGKPYILQDSPVVIGFGTKSDKPVWGLMRRFQNEIHQGLHRPGSPFLLVNQNGVHAAPTCRAIARNDWDTVKMMVQ